jgi:hypothetical protein
LFSRDGGKKPVTRNHVYKALYQALERIGIPEAERKRRNLSVHGWRHFLNTTLLMANVSDDKVMSVTGHTTKKMKKRYTHFDNTRMADVIEVQEKLLLPEPEKKSNATGPGKKRKPGAKEADTKPGKKVPARNISRKAPGRTPGRGRKASGE